MNLEDIEIEDMKPTEVSKAVSKLDSKEEKEKLKEKYSQMIEERMEEEGEEEDPEVKTDRWKCVRCEKAGLRDPTFEYDKGEIPLECPHCNKSSNKTRFEALTGPYQYFNFSNRKRFVPKRLAEDIIEDYQFRTLEDNEEIYYFDGVYYKPQGSNLIKREVQERLGEESVKNRIDEVINYIKIQTLTPLEKFDPDPYILAVDNGHLNLKTGDLEDPTPERLITTKIPVEYNPEVDFKGSNIEEFLNDILDKEYLPPLQELFGYLLFKKYSYKKGFMFKGPAHTGKTTLLNLMKRFLGQDNITDQSLKDLSDYKFARASLFQKLANLSDDLDDSKINNIGTFKMLTGSSSINAPIKHKQDQLIFENYATMVFTANRYPRITDPDQAWWERWILIEFKKQFFPDDPETIPQDQLMERITQDKELSGLLNWSIEGFRRLIDQGHFTRPEKSKQIEKKWIKETDSLKAFVLEYCEEDPDNRVIKEDFYSAYTDYCEKENLPVKDKRVVGRNLPSNAPYVDSKRPKIKTEDSNRQRRVWEGIKLKGEYSNNNRPIGEDPDSRKDEDQTDLTIVEEDHDIITEKEIYDQADDDKEIFIPDLSEELDKTPSEIKPKLESMVDQGKLVKVKEGVYRLA